MTGHGVGQAEVEGGGTILAEIRSVNNRHLKVNMRLSDGLGGLEPAVENLVRSNIRRGSVNVSLFWHGRPVLDLYQIRPDVAESYARQCRLLSDRLGMEQAIRWSDLIALPGVIAEAFSKGQSNPELEASALSSVQQALNELEQMRTAEGQAMQRELREQLSTLKVTLELIDQRVPYVMSEYRQRLKGRVASAITEALGQSSELESSSSNPSQVGSLVKALVSDTDLLREIALMADRSDVREEVVRLRSHFSQFGELLTSSESQGRRLDFLVQEMFREANTIGSKASDATISQHVVEIKATLEQMREMIQNIE